MSNTPGEDTRPQRVRVPRASFTVTLLNDPDYLTLMSKGRHGVTAFGVFGVLVIGAKLQRNNGRYPSLIVASKVTSIDVRTIRSAIDLIRSSCESNNHSPWIEMDDEAVVIRSFEVWNTENRGGERPGAGRPPKSNRNQFDSRAESRPRAPAVAAAAAGADLITTAAASCAPNGQQRASSSSENDAEAWEWHARMVTPERLIWTCEDHGPRNPRPTGKHLRAYLEKNLLLCRPHELTEAGRNWLRQHSPELASVRSAPQPSEQRPKIFRAPENWKARRAAGEVFDD